MVNELIENVLGEFGFTVKYINKEYAIEFLASKITGVGDDGPVYEMKGAQSSMDTTLIFDESERFINGFIKWNGCSHYYFGDDTGYLHLCGKHNINEISKLIKIIYNRCGELIAQNGHPYDEFPCD